MKKIAFIMCLVSIELTAQVTKSSLPILANPKDSLVVNCEAWIESPDSEMEQRLLIVKLENSLNKVHKILKKKQWNEKQIDTLIHNYNRIVKEKDSVLFVLDSVKTSARLDVRKDVKMLQDDLKSVKNKYFEMRRSRNIWRRNTFISLASNVLLLFVLL